MLRAIAVVILALGLAASSAAGFASDEGGGPRQAAQDAFLIPGGGLSEGGVVIKNPKRALPWGRSGNVWQTTTRNIACRYWPKPPRTIECMTKNDGFLAVLGRIAIDTYDEPEYLDYLGIRKNTPILRWGQYVRRGPFRCISRRAYLSCFNLRTRRGFELSRFGYSAWNHPRWSPYPKDEG